MTTIVLEKKEQAGYRWARGSYCHGRTMRQQQNSREVNNNATWHRQASVCIDKDVGAIVTGESAMVIPTSADMEVRYKKNYFILLDPHALTYS